MSGGGIHGKFVEISKQNCKKMLFNFGWKLVITGGQAIVFNTNEEGVQPTEHVIDRGTENTSI